MELIERIENIVCIGEGFIPADIHVSGREALIKETRQIIMYFAKENTSMTWNAIAYYFGHKEHSTAINAYKRISGLIDTDRQFRIKMDKYNKRIKAVKIDRMVELCETKLTEAEVRMASLEKEMQGIKDYITDINKELQLANRRTEKLMNN